MLVRKEAGYAGQEEVSNQDSLTPTDWQIIRDYHGMQEEQKKRLLKYMEVLKQLEELEENNGGKDGRKTGITDSR